MAQRFKDNKEVTQVLDEHLLKSESFYKSVKEDDLGTKENWAQTSFSKNLEWKEITCLNEFAKQFVGLKFGVMWFKTEVEIPKSLAGKLANLLLGIMSTTDETYVNGEKVGGINSSYTNRDYTFRFGLLKAGKNTITIRLTS